MGTNYYARSETCKKCGRYEEIHIGKSSVGWQFSFHATPTLKSAADWFSYLASDDVEIYDEYGMTMLLDEFLLMTTQKQKGALNHAEKHSEGGSYVDSEGFSMSPYEFS